MKKQFVKCSAIVFSLFLILTISLPINVCAASDVNSSKIIIKLNTGSNKFTVNGTKITAEKTFKKGDVIYIPLRAVLEAIGADVNFAGQGKVNILYRDVSVNLKVGNQNIYMNDIEKKLKAPPVYVKKTIMIPCDLIKQCFNADVKTDIKTGEISITINDDGSLSDLSFLISSIGKAKAGNSYFGWSVNAPKGSRIMYQSFNSKSIQLINESRNIELDVFVELNEGSTLEEYYQKITDDPYEILKGDLVDSSLNTQAKPGYIELLYNNKYDEAVYHKIFNKGKYFYNIAITSYNETNPNNLKNDKYLAETMNSFKLEYNNTKGDITDLSKIKYGLAHYYNYLISDSGKKYFSWDMSITPEWDIMQSESSNPYITQFGTSIKNNLSIEISQLNGNPDIMEYGKSIINKYETNLNLELYKLIKSGKSSVAGYTGYNMVYDVKMGKNTYRFNEYFIISGKLVYNITLKSSVDSYDDTLEQYNKMLETFKPSTKDTDGLITEMEKYQYDIDKNRIGKDNSLVSYENKQLLWKAKFPGYWHKDNAGETNYESFNKLDSGSEVIIEAVEKKESNSKIPDNEKFQIMSFVNDMDLEPIKVDTIQKNEKTVKVYKYRLDEEDSDTYADVYFYIIEGSKYYYCFMSSIPDMTINTRNLNEIKEIWDSFETDIKTNE